MCANVMILFQVIPGFPCGPYKAVAQNGSIQLYVLYLNRYAGAGIWTRVESLEGSRARPDYTTPASLRQYTQV